MRGGDEDVVVASTEDGGIGVRCYTRPLEGSQTGGTTVLISEQNVRFATELADRVLIIEQGEIRYEGTPAELSTHPEVREKYLMV